ncbi:hypothetical protein E1B28_004375 [Marasmius oreades]|uniref:Uncharacterized protein n=1 Tax=Marasmius oreades TaxID=181124 RepID=A0A9P7UYE3_9AGAR|nr:uncharacterized protein E1B28_004375 [Marasmius oreades]KAG7096979.1 hypothetical protein E1B28_004375 [Marasmius oreades]
MALRFFLLFLLFSFSYSQFISTSTPVPPLQWLNLTPRLTGTSKPPPLKDAFIAYDQTSHTVIIFGGESQSGFPSSETYLLNLNTLSWSKPAPPANLQQSPSARSALGSIYGPDFAANSRGAFMLYGGTGPRQEVLLDAWEFDFQFQFWSHVQVTPGGPGAESGIAGGLDTRGTNIQATNNTFYVVKSGSDSGLWRFNVSGTLASNIPDGVLGSWDHKPLANLPPFSDSASTVVGSKVISIGGCTRSANDSCAFIAGDDTSGQPSFSNIPSCASPRTGAKLVPNLSTASSGFSSQVFLLLGNLDPDWNDGNGLDRGEVAVLDINTETWSRLIPSGDPDASTTIPGSREGAAVSALQGQGGSRSSSDIIAFGGRDVSGNYLDEVWILRAYDGVVSSSSSQWAGFGDGKLQSGYEAGGTGVVVQYLSKCATLNSSPTSNGSSSPTNTSSGGNGPGIGGGSDSDPVSKNRVFDTSVSHKVLSPVSIVLLFLAILLQRASQSHEFQYANRHMAFMYACGFILFIAYGLGMAGLATSFTTISNPAPSPSSSLILKTTHSQAGLGFFVILYGLVPGLYLLQLRTRLIPRPKTNESEAKTSPRHSEDKSHVGTMSHNSSLLSSARPRSQSFGPSTVYRPSHDRSDENDAVSMTSSGPQRTFEVMNRPKRRRPSGGGLAIMLQEAPRAASRSLSEIDWLQRRRSLNAVGELDYAISQAIRVQEYPPTPATTDVLVASAPGNDYQQPPIFPSPLEIITRIFLQLSLCGLCVITLIALWSVPSSKVFFALFLAWTLLSYSLFISLAWRGLPPISILSVLVARLRGKTTSPPPSVSPTPEQYQFSTANTPTPLATSPGYPFPVSGSGPYIHHNPPHRTAGPEDFSYVSPRSVEDYDDADEDEDTRQQRIEGEMGRREVSIVTVPKRKLWIANPS